MVSRQKGALLVGLMLALALSGCANYPYGSRYGTTYGNQPYYGGATPVVVAPVQGHALPPNYQQPYYGPNQGQQYGQMFGTVAAIDGAPSSSGSGLGTALGGLIGGLAGHQMGNGRGKTAATIVAAVAGAMVGNQIEANNNGYGGFRVHVQLDQGGYQVFELGSVGDLRVGDRVRVDNGSLYRY